MENRSMAASKHAVSSKVVSESIGGINIDPFMGVAAGNAATDAVQQMLPGLDSTGVAASAPPPASNPLSVLPANASAAAAYELPPPPPGYALSNSKSHANAHAPHVHAPGSMPQGVSPEEVKSNVKIAVKQLSGPLPSSISSSSSSSSAATGNLYPVDYTKSPFNKAVCGSVRFEGHPGPPGYFEFKDKDSKNDSKLHYMYRGSKLDDRGKYLGGLLTKVFSFCIE